MSLKIGVFSIASKNYLAYVRVLMNSVAAIHPEYARYLCLADQAGNDVDAGSESFKIVQADQINIPDLQDMVMRYDIMEFNTAVKPYMIRWLFDNTDLDCVIYLDPDIQVFSRFDRLEEIFRNGASFVLTPHITEPLEDDYAPNDHHMLQAGVFNLGFVAVRRCEEALRFVDWWGRRLATMCVSDVSNALFTDQKWCDLAPCFLDKLFILKDRGYNVAYWNLAQRMVTQNASKKWIVDGTPLVFFHFSGVNAEKRNIVSKHQNRLSWSDIENCEALFNKYFDALIASGWNEAKKYPYAYSRSPDGILMVQILRRYYRQIYQNEKGFSQPGDGLSLITRANQLAILNFAEGQTDVSELMAFIHSLRPDLQLAFPLSSDEGRKSFRNWFECSAQREYGIEFNSIEHSVEENSSPLDKKKIVRNAYQMMHPIEAFGKSITPYLPSTWVKSLRLTAGRVRIWLLRRM